MATKVDWTLEGCIAGRPFCRFLVFRGSMNHLRDETRAPRFVEQEAFDGFL
jgi:hypothetical protein